MARHYFPHRITHPFRLGRFTFSHIPSLARVAGHRLFLDVAVSLIGIFMPIFWYQLFGSSLALTLLFYAGDFLTKMPFYVPAAKMFSRIGLKASMFIGVLGYVGFFVISYVLDQGQYDSLPLMIGLMYVALVLISTFYWAPFHVDMAESMSKGKRGTQLGMLRTVQKALLVVAPLAGGVLIQTHGYYSAFLIGIGLVLCSMIPLWFMPKFEAVYEFGYVETFQKLFSKQFRPMTLSMMAYGAEEIVGGTVWPIFLFIMFDHNLLNVGGFAALIVFISLILELFVGKETDKVSPKRMVHIGTSVYALGWLWKGFVQTVSGVFAATTFHTFGSIMMRTPVDALAYNQAADSGHYIDEYTVIREMALSTGRIVMLFVLIALTSFFPMSVAFVLAAFVSFGINLLVDYHVNAS